MALDIFVTPGRRVSGRCGRRAARRGGSCKRIDRPRGRLDSPPRVRARRRAAVRLGRCRGLVRRRPLRGRRAIPARTSCSCARRCSTDSSSRPPCAPWRRRFRPMPPLPCTTRPSRTRCSISSCSASARTDTPHRSFPNAPSLDVTDRLAVAVEPGLEPFVQRITLTIPALEAGRHVVFLAVGEGKAPAVRRAFGEEPSHSTPASLVRSREGVTTVILDEAAASLLG